MALDPQCKAFLDRAKSFNIPDLPVQGVHFARSNGHGEPDISGPLDPSVHLEHRYMTTATADVPITIYTPTTSGPKSGMAFFHGGGWVLNYINKYDAQLTAMAAKTNSVIVAVNYQKAPEHKFPIPFDDCYTLLEWMNANQKELGITTGKIGVGGDSAGGNLASAVALAARDRGKIALAYQWLVYPCNGPEFVDSADVPNALDYGLTQPGMKWLWDQYLATPADRKNPYCVPHSATSFKDLPPTVIVTAEYDVLRADGIAYMEKLKAAGVQVTYQDCPGMIHGFFNYGKYVDAGIAIRDFFATEINRILAA